MFINSTGHDRARLEMQACSWDTRTEWSVVTTIKCMGRIYQNNKMHERTTYEDMIE